jgi:hypothetical protein
MVGLVFMLLFHLRISCIGLFMFGYFVGVRFRLLIGVSIRFVILLNVILMRMLRRVELSVLRSIIIIRCLRLIGGNWVGLNSHSIVKLTSVNRQEEVFHWFRV